MIFVFPKITKFPFEASLQLLRQLQKHPWILNVKIPKKGSLIMKLRIKGKH